MPNYRRPYIPGGTYFITQVTYRRVPWLCRYVGRQALKDAIITIKKSHPFSIDAIVLLPEHFHCLLTLPPDDADFSALDKWCVSHAPYQASHWCQNQSPVIPHDAWDK